MTCRFCSAAAVALFALPEGCACFPDDRGQALCIQHVDRASPRGEMTLLRVLDAPLWDWYRSTLHPINRPAAPEEPS